MSIETLFLLLYRYPDIVALFTESRMSVQWTIVIFKSNVTYIPTSKKVAIIGLFERPMMLHSFVDFGFIR